MSKITAPSLCLSSLSYCSPVHNQTSAVQLLASEILADVRISQRRRGAPHL